MYVMDLKTFSDLVAQGYNNREIGAMMIETGLTSSESLAPKFAGVVRRMLQRGYPETLMTLTGVKTDGKDNPVSKKYSRKSTHEKPVDGLVVDKITTNPYGGQWVKYKNENPDTYDLLKAELQKAVEPLDIKPRKLATGTKALEINITDHHFGKIPYSYKDEDWTLETAKAEYLKAIEHHLATFAHEDISTIIFPTGNDLLHINNTSGTTRKGTPMEYRENYHRLYAFVRECVAGAVLKLSEDYKVIVPIVAGNHDEDACYRLGDYLEGLFSQTSQVVILNKGHDRKYVPWGNSLIMFTHGEKVNMNKLHGAFSVDVPDLNANARHRYVHVGHLHKSKKVEVLQKTINDEHLGTEVEICPSLSPTDNWHFNNLYTGNQRRSKAYLYSFDKGRLCDSTYAI